VFRPGTPSVTYLRTTRGGPVSYIPWGQTGDYSTPFDFDGDGQQDVMVQRNVGGAGQFWIRRSSDGGVAIRNFGLGTDLLVMGNWDGDATEDITVTRLTASFLQHWTVGSSTSVVTFRTWGTTATDWITQGDWDGDGITDLAIYRPPTGQFWISRSSGGVSIVSWGMVGDFPVGSWRTK